MRFADEIFILRYNQGQTVEQVAEMLEVNYRLAKNLLHRELLTLRNELREFFDYCIAVFRCF
jgi:DNA-directed RNA polymerase specialized sigma24 family protein